MKQKLKAKPGIGRRIFFAFLLFTVLTLGILWILQTAYLEKIYRKIKLNMIEKSAATIAENIDNGDLEDLVGRISMEENICIQVIDSSGALLADSDVVMDCIIHRIPTETKLLFARKAYENGGSYLELLPRDSFKNENYDDEGFKGKVPSNDQGMSESVIYCLLTNSADELNTQRAVLINSNIIPLTATTSTLRVLLLWVSVLSIILSAVLAIFISKSISHPIIRLNEGAKAMAEGNYDVHFDGGALREMSELADTLNYATGELSQVESMRRELMANISHDLRTPLTMISGYSEVMRDIEGENTPENLQIIIDEAHRLTLLVNDMLDLSQLEVGKNKLKNEILDIGELTDEVIERFKKMTEHKGYVFIADIAKGVCVDADRIKLERVIYNLISNAVNYSHDDKTITIRQSVKNGVVLTEVIDRGEGIAADKLKYIWQRYYRDEHHRRPVAGTGLGLSIVKNVLDAYAANYGVESEEGVGSRFWFELKAV